jgi:threonine/homoserine/homoserine lactone efflux protein
MSFLSLCLIHLMAVISPGPGFAVQLKNSLQGGRMIGLFTALGIAVGDLTLLLLAIFGIHAFLLTHPQTLHWIQVFGAIYLGYLGVKGIRVWYQHKKPETQVDILNDGEAISVLASFRSGYIITILNPKAIVYFVSISSQFLAITENLVERLIYSIVLICITFLWFGFVALFAGSEKTRSYLNDQKHRLEGIMGVILVFYSIYALING